MLAHSHSRKLQEHFPGYQENMVAPFVEIKEMTAKEFLRAVFGLDKINPDIAALHEDSREYHREARRVLTEVLGVTEVTLRSWGSGWKRMPQYYRLILGTYYKCMMLQKDAHTAYLRTSRNRGLGQTELRRETYLTG